VCHEPTHLFQEVTAALADGPSAFVQIHGFAVPGDNTAHGRRRTDHPEIIVSAGRAHGSTLHSTAVADAWAQIFGAPAVRRYPEEIDVLGGTTNVQARLLHARADAAFVHVELSSTMRARLLASDEERAAWARALLQALRCSLASP
jgi:predicted nucleic acid-binding protein